jgi:hypothetical protein
MGWWQRRWKGLLAAAVAGSFVAALPAGAQEAPTEAVLVTYSTAAGLDRAVADGGRLDAADEAAAEIADHVAVAELTSQEIEAIEALRGVVAVEPDAAVFAAEAPDDPCYQDPGLFPLDCQPQGSWHVDRIGLPSAWDLTHGSAGEVVAVLDSGTGQISELAGKLLPEIDATGGTAQCSPAEQVSHHGTAVAAVIAALTDNGTSIPGVGWDTRVLPIRVFGTSACTATLSSLVNGLTLARNNGAGVVNLSLTANVDSDAVRTAINDTVNAGIPVVAAAGNSGSSNPTSGFGGYPAFYSNVIAVGATDANDARSIWANGASNFGDWVDVYAPGTAIQTFRRDGIPISIDGTSFATPITAGVVAMIRAVRPSLAPAQIRDILARSADPANGIVRLDADGALHDAVFAANPMPGAAAYPGSGVTDVVARSNDRRPWARTVGGDRWTVLDGLLAGDPDLASSAAGTLELVGRGIDGGAYRRQRVGTTWGPWLSIGGQFTSDLTAVSWGTGRLDVFGRGLDGALWHRSFDGSSSSGWESLGGGLSSEPDVASWAPGRLDVFARGLDGAMWHRALGPSGWFPWESLGGGFRTGPGAVSNTGDVVHVAAVGLDSQVWIKFWNGVAWSAWSPLGGILASSPELVQRGPGTLEVYARAGDARLWVNRFGGGGQFTGWVPT